MGFLWFLNFRILKISKKFNNLSKISSHFPDWYECNIWRIHFLPLLLNLKFTISQSESLRLTFSVIESEAIRNFLNIWSTLHFICIKLLWVDDLFNEHYLSTSKTTTMLIFPPHFRSKIRWQNCSSLKVEAHRQERFNNFASRVRPVVSGQGLCGIGYKLFRVTQSRVKKWARTAGMAKLDWL